MSYNIQTEDGRKVIAGNSASGGITKVDDITIVINDSEEIAVSDDLLDKIKDVDTALAETTVSDNVPTSSAVVTFVNEQIEIITDVLGDIGDLLDFINGEVV